MCQPLDNQALANEICATHGAFINNQALSTLQGFQLIGLAEKHGFKIDVRAFMSAEELEAQGGEAESND